MSLYYVYIRNRNLKKHCFVTVLWVLISVSVLLSFTQNYLRMDLYSLAARDFEAANELFENHEILYNEFFQDSSNIMSITHWVFAIKYAHLALQLRLVYKKQSLCELQ